jgi:hypothetical protein
MKAVIDGEYGTECIPRKQSAVSSLKPYADGLRAVGFVGALDTASRRDVREDYGLNREKHESRERGNKQHPLTRNRKRNRAIV